MIFVQSFFTGNLNKKSQTISYGYIVDGEEKVDEVLISIYRGQHTFTGEEMVEINCHGGVFITNKVLSLCLKKELEWLSMENSLSVHSKWTY